MNSSELSKAWIEHIGFFVKGDSGLSEYPNAKTTAKISVLTIIGDSGKVCASVGLNGSHQPPIELLMDSLQSDIDLEPIMAEVASDVQERSVGVKPGVVIEGGVKKHHPELELAHLLIIPQFQWSYEMSETELPQGVIYPLLAVPMSDMELIYCHRIGYGSLDHLWERREINLLDWKRPSAVSQIDIDRALIRNGYITDS